MTDLLETLAAERDRLNAILDTISTPDGSESEYELIKLIVAFERVMIHISGEE